MEKAITLDLMSNKVIMKVIPDVCVLVSYENLYNFIKIHSASGHNVDSGLSLHIKPL